MNPKIISLGRKIAIHMICEDALFEEILNCHPSEEESVFLTTCIFRQGAITKNWK